VHRFGDVASAGQHLVQVALHRAGLSPVRKPRTVDQSKTASIRPLTRDAVCSSPSQIGSTMRNTAAVSTAANR